MTRKITRTDLKLYTDLLLIVLYIVSMVTGILSSTRVIKAYWHGSAVFYLTLVVGFHIFLNARQLLSAINKKLNDRLDIHR